MVVSIVLGVAAFLRRDVTQHRAWMTRGYAIGLGRGDPDADLDGRRIGAGKPTELTSDRAPEPPLHNAK
jgi:hypothetical protein